MERIIYIADSVLWLLTAMCVLYILIFALASLRKRRYHYPEARKKHRIAVIFPAYREDNVIESTVISFLEQDYPRELFDIVVVSDHMQEETDQALKRLPILFLKAEYQNSSKAQALNLAITQLPKNKYDIIVILDADNTVAPDYLHQINNAFYSGASAIQTHRTAKNRNTDVAVLDAVSEEINNSIFRKGHVCLGLSSALIGSGMSFDYSWFADHVLQLTSAGEDKELEILLLKQRIFIDYLENVFVYDEKTQQENAFSQQRRRWLATQISQWKRVFCDMPQALFTLNIDYCDKLFQWLMPPRVLLLGFTSLITIALLFLNWTMSLKWWGLLFILGISFCLAIPDYLVDERFKKAIHKIPYLFFLMALNLFKLRGASKKFIHTGHSGAQE